MPRIDNAKLDLRFRALAAIPERVPPIFTTSPGAGTDGDSPVEYRAIVLLVPGATRSALVFPAQLTSPTTPSQGLVLWAGSPGWRTIEGSAISRPSVLPFANFTDR